MPHGPPNHDMIAVQSYAPSIYEAGALNKTVRKLMLAIAESEAIMTRCELNSDYNFTDTTTKKYRCMLQSVTMFLMTKKRSIKNAENP